MTRATGCFRTLSVFPGIHSPLDVRLHGAGLPVVACEGEVLVLRNAVVIV